MWVQNHRFVFSVIAKKSVRTIWIWRFRNKRLEQVLQSDMMLVTRAIKDKDMVMLTSMLSFQISPCLKEHIRIIVSCGSRVIRNITSTAIMMRKEPVWMKLHMKGALMKSFEGAEWNVLARISPEIAVFHVIVGNHSVTIETVVWQRI